MPQSGGSTPERRRGPRLARWFGRGTAALVVLWPEAASAEMRTVTELEPVTPHFSAGGFDRASISTLGVTVGFPTRTLIPYVGGGLGFFTIQVRAGLTWLPADLTNSGLMVRLEARPQLFLAPCAEPALFGNLGVGYQWPLEHSYPGEPPGAAFYLLPSFDGGEAWIRPNCATRGASEPVTPKFFVGGTVALGIDW